MIRVGLQLDARGHVVILSCWGHARLTVEDGGEDLLCAGVSALSGALALGLSQVVGASVCLKEDYGFFYVRLEHMEADRAEKAQILMKTAVVALEELAKYNVGFLEIERYAYPQLLPECENLYALALEQNKDGES